MIRYRTILDRNRNKSCRTHSGTSCPYIFIADGNVVYHSYDTIHALSLNFQRRKKVKMKVFYLLTVCFRSLVEPASLLGFSDQLEDPSYLFSKQNSQFQSKFQYFSRQPDFSFVVFPLQDIHIRKIISLVKRSVTSHGNSPK